MIDSEKEYIVGQTNDVLELSSVKRRRRIPIYHEDKYRTAR